MIGWFPSAYPDESFYSLCARYAETVRYPNKEHVLVELFTKRGLSLAVDLPSSLQAFVSNLPLVNFLTIEKIIDDHTLLPFYAAFLPSERTEEIRRLMSNSTGVAIHKLSGITPSTIRPPSALRFCPICVKTDRQEFGIAYWHRLHQIPGVELCSLHSVFLEDSTGRIKNAVYKADLSAAEQNIPDVAVREVDFDNETHRLLMQLAKDIEWILNQKNLCFGYKYIENLYTNALQKTQLLLLHGAVNVKKLNQKLRDHFSREFLQIVQSDYDENKDYNWVARIIPHLKHGKVHHPLRHLLLIRALDETPQSFFELEPISYVIQERPVKSNLSVQPLYNSFIEKSYFFEGPYPCLNAVCLDYRKLKVKKYRIHKPSESQHFILIVTCKCGFSYSRKGPDASPQDLFRRNFIRRYGKLWENELKKLWDDSTLSLNQIAKLLDVKFDTAKKRAMALGLKFPRQGPNNKVLAADNQKKLEEKKRKKDKVELLLIYRRDENRRIWIEALKQNPSATRTQLKNIIEPKAGLWLTEHDKIWLESNQPAKWKRVESARQVDWKNRDDMLAVEIKEAAERIRCFPGEPIKICPATIARETEHRDWVTHSKYKKKLPVSQSILNSVTETRLDFDLRRIRYAVEELKSETGSAAFSTIAQRAKIEWNRWELPEIKTSIEAAIIEIGNNTRF